ncbi:hypothetical protein ACPPVU_09595 [Mucilaginibacter sp. McL0603]|uniref:hypothetical protein n=1 Tax=Mucilaginibacter sp. McL0603 TaxID=3415670 RepID=UPI003CE6C898
MLSQDKSNTPEDNERPFVNGDRPVPIIPERHGCVTAWLIVMLIINSICTLIYFFASNLMEKRLKVSFVTIAAIVIIGVLNSVFSVMLLYWKKAGFYGFFATTIISFIINFCIKLPLIPTILGLCGIAILYGILHIKKGGRSTWYYLK